MKRWQTEDNKMCSSNQRWAWDSWKDLWADGQICSEQMQSQELSGQEVRGLASQSVDNEMQAPWGHGEKSPEPWAGPGYLLHLQDTNVQ